MIDSWLPENLRIVLLFSRGGFGRFFIPRTSRDYLSRSLLKLI